MISRMLNLKLLSRSPSIQIPCSYQRSSSFNATVAHEVIRRGLEYGRHMGRIIEDGLFYTSQRHAPVPRPCLQACGRLLQYRPFPPLLCPSACRHYSLSSDVSSTSSCYVPPLSLGLRTARFATVQLQKSVDVSDSP